MVGAAIFFVLEHWITSFTNSWMIFLGAILVVLVLIFPKGVLGTLMAWADKLRKGKDS
jgi:branched-chain amino acid transport system permease protein